MVSEGVLVDAGPLVAILSARDQFHDDCLREARTLRGPFYTSWPVIAEAVYLLKNRTAAVQKLLSRIRTLKLRILQLTADDIDGISAVLVRYADHHLDLADATLMYLAEREGIETVFTIDQRHFSIYRTSQGNSLILRPAIRSA